MLAATAVDAIGIGLCFLLGPPRGALGGPPVLMLDVRLLPRWKPGPPSTMCGGSPPGVIGIPDGGAMPAAANAAAGPENIRDG